MSRGSGPRQSLLLPLAIPVGALAVIGAALFGFSRVLLRVSHTAATATALAVAAGIMVVASIVASRKEAGGTAILSLVGGVVGIAMFTGGAALLLGQHEAGGGEGQTVVALAAPVNAAVDGYAQTELMAPAAVEFAIRLTSEDPVVHNVAVAPAQGETPLVTGPDVLGPGGSGEVAVGPLDAGGYFFFCTYHPTTMTGTLTVQEGVTSPGEGLTVLASGIAFDTDTIELAADTEATITLDNADAGATHNIAIYTDESATTLIWDGPDVLGPGSIDYTVPPIAAGEYYFHCDTHPPMLGTVIVDGGPEGGGPAPPDDGGG
ncbi:MAG: cupredoxin domain-containing protein [Actinomycetota bacterium]